jgi:hypothetical protein
MIWLTIFSMLLGAVLAQRFRVMVLMPASAMVLVLAASTAVVQGHAAWWTISLAAIGISALQLGYFIGLGIRFVLEAAVSEGARSVRTNATAVRQAQPH